MYVQKENNMVKSKEDENVAEIVLHWGFFGVEEGGKLIILLALSKLLSDRSDSGPL